MTHAPLTFDIGMALHGLATGHRVRRSGWPPQDYLVYETHGVITGLFRYCGDALDHDYWQPTQPDVLAADWEVAQDIGSGNTLRQ